MDYEKLGFKSGLEIHQQLETKKLFCNCQSLVNDTNDPDIIVKRRLRAVVGETGEVDKAAAYEQSKSKYFIYEACSSSSCLVELDEEPPHPINKDAVKVVVQAANMFNARLVDEIQFMRKTVIDGSNVSGFQRTALVAYGGYIETSKGKVKIDTICLEEEAAKKIETTDEYVRYRLDRLGVPLLEVATDASIKDPEHAKECAEKIGMILRSTGKVKRGIGTIRQDVNVSIKNGDRTEIKGFQDLKSIPNIVENEVKRQLDLIEKGEKIEKTVRKAEQDGSTKFLRPMPGSARLYPETDVIPIKVEDVEVEEVELIEEKAKRYSNLGLGKDLAVKLAKDEKASWFDDLAARYKSIKPAFIAETLISGLREISRKYDKDISKLSKEDLSEIFAMLEDGKISKNFVLDVIIDYIEDSFDIAKYKGVDDSVLEEEIKKIVDSNPNAGQGALMGMIMAKFQGKADGKKVNDILRKFLD